MRIVIADVLGMCFGVRDALTRLERIAQPAQVTIHGELVHNEAVLDRLKSRGFQMSAENQRRSLPLTDTVLVTAHGISQKERSRLESAGKTLIDTTCPLVTRAHHAAQELDAQGYHVLVIGRRHHVEVQGIVEDLTSYDIIESPRDVISYPHVKLGVMCQTTTPLELARAIRPILEARNPQAEIRWIDTICHPTKEHQSALEQLLDRVQAMVVVGGKNSNNTRQLVARCLERDVPALHVQGPDDLNPDWFHGIDSVGLTAGTSTLAETIDAVRIRLESFA